MADKLSESTWTGFTKDLTKKNPKLDELKPKLDDKALVSALKEFDKTDESKPEPRLKALEELIKQIPEQIKTLVKRKKELGDKPFGEAKDKLYALLQDAENLHKSAVAKAAEAKAAEAKAAQAKGKGKDDEEEEESPALLSSKMIPLLRELKKGEKKSDAEVAVTMPFLLALAGKETVVLVSRRAISPARGKLLKEQMAQPSGLKFIRGDCLYEKGALTFVVQSPGAALAKRLRQALLEQTAMRWKVRVRGEDGVVEEDGAEEEQPLKPATPEQLAYTQRLLKVRDRYQQALREQHPKAVQYKELMDQANAKANEQQDYAGAIQALQALEKAMDEPERTQGGGVDPGEAFKVRLTALLPRMKEAQTAGHPGAQDAKLKASEAGVFARKGDWARVDELMKQAEALLAEVTPSVSGATPTAKAAGGATHSAPVSQKVAFTQTRLAWDETRKLVQGELKKLESSVLSECKDEPDFAQISQNSKVLYTVLDYLDERLMDKLDEALNAQTPQQRKAFHQEAREIVDEYIDYVKSDELLRDIDDNGFVDIKIGATVTQRLNAMAAQLKSAVAA